MEHLKSNLDILRKKIILEYCILDECLESAIDRHVLMPDGILDYAEYFYIKMRIYICFKDYSTYMQQMDDKIISFLLNIKNTSDYLAVIYENGLAGDCDVKSVEGIEKLMIFAYNNALYKAGRYDFYPIDTLF